jgi:hypothetical protein
MKNGPSRRRGTLRREWRGRMVAHLSERGPPFAVDGDLAPRPQRMLHGPHYPASKGKAT